MVETPEVVQGDCRPRTPSVSTKDLGWPDSDLKIYKMNDQWYFNTEAVIKEFGIKKRVKYKGYKCTVDKLLADQGNSRHFDFLKVFVSKHKSQIDLFMFLMKISVHKKF